MKPLSSAAALLALLCAAPASAAKVLAVLSADHGAYRKALDGFQAEFGSTVPIRLASSELSLDPDTRVVVAIGGRAALASYPANVAVIYCLVPAIELDAPRTSGTRVRMVPKPEHLLSRIKTAQPNARALAVLWAAPSYQRYVQALIAEGKRSGPKVLSVPIDSDADLPRALRLLEGRADALWLAPDPLLVTPAIFKMISGFSREAKAVFYAPTSDLVLDGATASVAVTPQEMGRAAASVARRALAGERPPIEVYAERVETVVDAARAAQAGLILSTDVVKTKTGQ